MRDSVYEVIFEYYKLDKYASKGKKETWRKYILSHLKIEFPDYNWSTCKPWSELSTYEQKYFIINCMKNQFLPLTPQHKKSAVEKTIKQDNEFLLQPYKSLKEYNKHIQNLYVPFYNPKASKEENHKAFRTYCKMSKKYFPDFIPPHYDDWEKENLNSDMRTRPYDIIQSFINDHENNQSISSSEIDHIVLHTLLKYFETTTKQTVDVDSIYQCLMIRNSFDNENFNELQEKDDPKLIILYDEEEQKLSKEEQIELSTKRQNELININAKYADAIRKLDNYDFIIPIEDSDE